MNSMLELGVCSGSTVVAPKDLPVVWSMSEGTFLTMFESPASQYLSEFYVCRGRHSMQDPEYCCLWRRGGVFGYKGKHPQKGISK